MKTDTFGYKLIKAFFSIYSGISIVIQFLLSFVFWKIDSDKKISLFPCLIVLGFSLFLISVFIKLSVDLFDEKSQNRVKVLNCIDSYKPYNDDAVILLTTNSDNFAIGGVVSLFQNKNGCEIFISNGQIINIQNDGNVQILIHKNKENEFDLEKIKKHESDDLKKLIIKPIVTMPFLKIK